MKYPEGSAKSCAFVFAQENRTGEAMTTEAPQKMQCRYIKSDAFQCRGLAIRGQLYCHSHGRDLRRRTRTATSPAWIEIPRLDNRADIQLVIADVARAVAAGTIDHNSARLLMAAARLASTQLPSPRALSVRGDEDRPAPIEPEPVEEIVIGPNGEELAPESPWYGINGKPERPWSFAEYLYHQSCPGNEDKPLPEEGYCNHMPPAGVPFPPKADRKYRGPDANPAPAPTPTPDQPAAVIDQLHAVAQVAAGPKPGTEVPPHAIA
jgi:hypothetical protein